MDDLISRQAAIDALDEYFERIGKLKRRGLNKGEKAISLDTVGAIKSLPPAEPKRGKWHYSDGKPARIGLSFGVICDQCGTESEYCTNFCGECGADMREANHESN